MFGSHLLFFLFSYLYCHTAEPHLHTLNLYTNTNMPSHITAMPSQQEDLLLSVSTESLHVICCTNQDQLQSSLRNALATFGPTSTQYLNIKYMTDELAAKIALEKLSISSSELP